MPQLTPADLQDPAISERISAIVDRFCKLQNQLAGALRHAHAMLGEKNRSFQDVVTWAISQNILNNAQSWLELRSLRNRLTHEYDLQNEHLPELIMMIRQQTEVLAQASTKFVKVCISQQLAEEARLPRAGDAHH